MTADPISASNTNPTFDQGSSITRSVPENSPADTSVGAAVMATDDEGGLVYRLGGPDGGSFGINTDGEIKTKSGITYNYESAKNTYSVTVSVHDRKDIASAPDTTIDDSIDVAISLTDANDAPTITSGDMTRTISENSTAVAAYMASDEDPSDTLSWSVENNADADDGNLFQINSAGELSFKIAPDFEDKQDVGKDNTYNVTVQATDGGGLYATRDVAVSVTNVNEAPVFADDSTTGFIVNENLPASTALELFTATDQDAGTDLMWSLEGDDADQFRITENGQGRGVPKFLTSPNYEAPTDSDKDNVYKITLKVRDNHMPQMQAMLAVTVEVQDVNERPVISGSSTADFMEIEFDVDDADLTAMDFLVASFSAYDDDGDDVSWSLGTSEDKAHFVITKNADGEGVLSFAIRPDYENPVDGVSDNVYRVVIRADDGRNESNSVGTFTVDVTVTNVDETPEITTTGPTHATPSFAEIEYDATTADLTVADYEARDEEGETITWSLGGTDSGDFTINSTSGVLSFASRPNFEIPVDGSTPPDNVYNIIVKATDASPTRKIREYPVAVAVTPIDEAPEIDGPDDNPNFPETPYDSASTPEVGTFLVRDEEGQDITWNLSGDDAGDFTITKDAFTQHGVVTFNNPPNYEDPADSDSRNTYRFTVQRRSTAHEHRRLGLRRHRDRRQRTAGVHGDSRNVVHPGRARRKRGLHHPAPGVLRRPRRRRRCHLVADWHGRRRLRHRRRRRRHLRRRAQLRGPDRLQPRQQLQQLHVHGRCYRRPEPLASPDRHGRHYRHRRGHRGSGHDRGRQSEPRRGRSHHLRADGPGRRHRRVTGRQFQMDHSGALARGSMGDDSRIHSARHHRNLQG